MIIPPSISSIPHNFPSKPIGNWSRTFHHKPSIILSPNSIEQLKQVIIWCKHEKRQLKVIGSCHSPSDLNCVNERGVWVNLEGLYKDEILEHNPTSSSITVPGSVTLHRLNELMGSVSPPIAISSLGSISVQTISGAISTCTHGSGWNFQTLSSYVTSMKLLLADESLSVLVVSADSEKREERDLYWAALCGLGSLGIILEVTMRGEHVFKLRDESWEMDYLEFVDDLEEIMKSGEHVRCHWFPHAGKVKISRLNRSDEPLTPPETLPIRIYNRFMTDYVQIFVLLLTRTFPILLPLLCKFLWHALFKPPSPADGKPYPWRSLSNDVSKPPTMDSGYSSPQNLSPSLPEKKVEEKFYPNAVVGDSEDIFTYEIGCAQYTYEGSIPIENSKEFLKDLNFFLGNTEEGRGLNGIVEIRVTEGDEVWLSPVTGKERRFYIGLVQYKPLYLPVPYRRLFRSFESLLFKHGGRPHWAKSHTCSRTQLEKLYPKFNDWLRVREGCDPDEIFLNSYMRRHLIGEIGEDMDMRRFKVWK